MRGHLPRPRLDVRRPLRVGLLPALAAALVLASCGGGDDSPSGQPVSADASSPAVSPLTGLPVDAVPRHPVVVVKIDNSEASAPQAGLSGADLVTEELVEGGITRLAVFFDSSTPKVVGPVRSARASDIGIVLPARATMVASGGAPQTLGRIKAAGVTLFGEGSTGFYRDGARLAPYNLFVRLPELVRTLKGEQPPSYLPFGSADDFPSGRPARSLEATFSGSSTTRWEFRSGKYANTNSNAGDGFSPDTVLVLRVPVGDAGYLDPAGNPVPETHLTGGGQAMVFHDGRVVRGSWHKDDLGSALTLSTAAGDLTLPPGRVWIELVPQRAGSVSYRP